jgi:type II secretory pathway component GspD/PulD (secretin)
VYSVRKKLPEAEAIQNTRTFVFQNADIKQAEDVIKGIVGDRGQVYAYAQGNTIVVKTTQEIMDDVAQIADRIDTSRRQVLIEARILELTDNKNKDHGVDWSQEGGLLNRSLSMGPFSWIQTDLNSGHFGQMPPSDIDPSSGDKYNPELKINQLTLNAGDLKVFLSALDQFTDIQTVSSPKVIVANGEKATIKIITKEPIIISTPSYSEQGQLQSIMYNQEADGTDPDTGKKRYATYDYGIMLDVTPTIYSEDNIAVHIVPTISRKDASKTVTRDISGDSSAKAKIIEFPVIDEKRVETYFTLANKQTAVIGGLTETTQQNIEKKVPILGSLPLLKKLFSYTSAEDVQKENVIFVTVTLEDGKNFDLERSIQKSPLTRRQLIREDNNQIIDDQAIDLFKAKDQGRITDEVKRLEKQTK